MTPSSGFEAKIKKSKSELQDNALKMQNMDSRIATQVQNSESVKKLVNSILEAQIEQLMRVSEFSPLTHAAKGEVVARNELKFSLRKAIETVLGRLDPNNSITKVLETTKTTAEKRQLNLAAALTLVVLTSRVEDALPHTQIHTNAKK